ncbi:cytochrome o ubiquinol oxidase subunit IV [Lichenibacterium ramalinae]|uniref:cytochrome o ubiquinol oxidase subunit IV n=1 Tax=Lichenibacterium ramalinae TaxID=2316527 RepID=UPI001A92FDA1|nr:cytochrome C oxidase subunit IV family protein [Lichenibacterium ramalinae]
MSGPGPSLPRRLARYGAAALWVATAFSVRPAAAPPARRTARPSKAEIAADRRRDLLTYGIGYGLALALTLLAFALVYWRWAEPPVALALVFGLGLVQVLVQFRCFLHIDFKGQARDDLLLILFSTLIVLLMVGGTLVVLFNLRARMM